MDVSLFRSISGQYQDLRRVNTTAMMNVISHHIEDQVIQHRLPVDFYAGFQRFSNFPEQLRRYSRLGAVCRRVYVFGVADYQPPNIPGIEFVELSPTSMLSKEWFLLVNTADFWTTLVTQEVEGRDQTSGGRRFDGLWSFNEVVVDRIALLVSQLMETAYVPIHHRNHNQQNVHISEISSRMLTMLETAEIGSQRRWTQLQTVQKIAEITPRTPTELLHDTAKILNTIFGAAGVVIALARSNRQYKVAAIEGDAIGNGWKMPITEGLTGRVIQQSRLMQVAEVRQSQDGDPLLPAAKGLISAPIMHRRNHGVITLGSAEPNVWTAEDAQTVMTIGHMLAIQLEKVSAVPATPQTPNGMFPLDTEECLRRVVTAQEGPMARLIALQRKLRAYSNTPTQLAILDDVDATSNSLFQAIKIAKRMLAKDAQKPIA